MASHTFPGRNPFGGAGPVSGGVGSMGNVPEEDEVATSPTASHFQSPFSQGAGAGPSSFAPGPGSAFAPPEQGFPTNYGLGRRTSVSAESMDPSKQEGDSANWKPPTHSKTGEQRSRIRDAVKSNFLFTHLANEQEEQILDALFEKPIPAKVSDQAEHVISILAAQLSHSA